MATMENCNLCGGQGLINFYHPLGPDLEDDLDTRRCPNCHGLGVLEPWRQVATGVPSHERGTVAPTYREETEAISSLIRQREEIS